MRHLLDQLQQVDADAQRTQDTRRATEDYLAVRSEWARLDTTGSTATAELWGHEHAEPAYRSLLAATAVAPEAPGARRV